MTVTENGPRRPARTASRTSSSSTPTAGRCPTSCAGSRPPTSAIRTTPHEYTSRAFHELEKEKLWSKVWQFACREEEIPDVGDTAVYDICDWSILVVRSAPDTIKAYYNACLHRGRQLREFSGWTNELRCPFHGFCWNLDGSLATCPPGGTSPTSTSGSTSSSCPR